MNNLKHGKKRKSKAARYIFLLLCCAFAVGGAACATMLAVDNADNKSRKRVKEYHNEVILQDSIYAMAHPDAALAKKIGTSDAIAFLGEEHTYLITTGGEEIINTASKLDGDRLEIDTNNRRLFKKGKTIWGNVLLSYKASTETKEILQLRELGFTRDHKTGHYIRAITVAGVVCAPARSDTPLPDKLKRNRDITFYRPGDATPPPGLADLEAIVTIPLAVALDIALSPVYLAGFVLVVLSL